LQFAQAKAQTKNCKRASTLPTQERISKYFFQRFKKNKTPDTQASQKSTRQMTQTEDIKMVVTHDRQERQPITAKVSWWLKAKP
jgi:6-pyruvoyl-tetrahydropterin synthase